MINFKMLLFTHGSLVLLVTTFKESCDWPTSSKTRQIYITSIIHPHELYYRNQFVTDQNNRLRRVVYYSRLFFLFKDTIFTKTDHASSVPLNSLHENTWTWHESRFKAGEM